jgi:hypothetical protein
MREICSPAQPALAQGVIYVDADATGAYDGTSWTDAYTNVQDALAAAASGDEIWVAEGVYYPDEGGGKTDNDPTASFWLANNVSLYGGFAATETLLSQRDWQAHVTVLSGDIDQNDITDGNSVVTDTDSITGTNAYHVVRAGSAVGSSAIFDGFTVTAGYADGSVLDDFVGGGMYNKTGDPTLSNILFVGNYASYNGGGMYNDEGLLTLTNVTFSNNEAGNVGGGLLTSRGDMTLADVHFNGNQANFGGGMHDYYGNSVLTNTTFDGNRALSGTGGGLSGQQCTFTLMNVEFRNNWASSSGGAIHTFLCPLTLTNVILSGNEAYYGGAIYNGDARLTMNNVAISGNKASYHGAGLYNSGGGDFVLTNVTFAGNNSSQGAAIYNLNSDAAVTLTNCIVWDNRSRFSSTGSFTVRYSDIQDGFAGTGNIAADPQFVAPVDYHNAPTTTGDLHLQFGSPAINTGDNTAVSTATDLDGNPRIVDSTVDMGAYEYPLHTIYLPCVMRGSS